MSNIVSYINIPDIEIGDIMYRRSDGVVYEIRLDSIIYGDIKRELNFNNVTLSFTDAEGNNIMYSVPRLKNERSASGNKIFNLYRTLDDAINDKCLICNNPVNLVDIIESNNLGRVYIKNIGNNCQSLVVDKYIWDGYKPVVKNISIIYNFPILKDIDGWHIPKGGRYDIYDTEEECKRGNCTKIKSFPKRKSCI